ncbi:hypothetical protein BB561_000654, partial [Smittium simulii]
DNLINLFGDLAEVRQVRMENTETQEAIKKLQSEENNSFQTELSHVAPRAPVADLIYFFELSEANSLAEKNFFCNPLTEKKPLNNTASTSVKKAVTTLDEASTCRCSIQDYPFRQYLVYKTMELPGKVSKLNEEQEDSLFNSEEFDTVVKANRKARKRPVRPKGPFCQRQQVASGIASTTAQNQQAAPTAPSSQSYKGNKRQNFPSRRKNKGRLSVFWAAWTKLTDNQWVKKIVSEGFQITFNQLSENQTTLSRVFPHQLYPHYPRITPAKLRLQRTIFPSGKIVPALPAGLWTNVNYASILSQKKDAQRGKQFYNNRSSRTIIKARYRGSKKANSWFLQTCSTTTFQNGIIDIDIQDDIEERLHDIDQSTRCVPTYSYSRVMQKIPEIPMEWENISVQSTSIRFFTQPFSLYQNTAPDNNLGTSLGNKYCVLFGRHYNIGEEPTNMPGEHQYSSIKAQRTRISDQGLKIIFCTKTDHQTPGNAYQLQADDSESPNRQGSRLEKGSIKIDNQRENYTKRTSFIYWEGTSNGCSTTPRAPNVEEIVGTEKQSLVKNIRLEFSSVNKGQCIAESDLVERSNTPMEWSFIHSRSSKIRNFYRSN